jgi:hypothetical protein
MCIHCPDNAGSFAHRLCRVHTRLRFLFIMNDTHAPVEPLKKGMLMTSEDLAVPAEAKC